MRYAIWCQVSGGITGYRFGWLKNHKGERKEYTDYSEAFKEASRLNTERKRIRRVLFAYQVLELNGETEHASY